MAKYMNGKFTEEKIKIKNKCMKTCLISLVIKNTNKIRFFSLEIILL